MSKQSYFHQVKKGTLKEQEGNSRSGKKILFVGNDVNYFITHRLVLARAVKKAGYEVHVALPKNGDLKDLEQELNFHFYPLVRWKGKLKDELQTIRGIYRIFKALSPDLVYLVTIKPVLFGDVLSRILNIPAMITTITGLGYIFLAKGIRASLVRITVMVIYKIALGHKNLKVIFQNQEDKKLFEEKGLVKEKDTTLIRGSGVDLSRFCYSPENGGIPIVMLATRMLKDKGVYEFVRAAELLRKRGTHANFVLVGDIEEGNPSSIKKYELEDWHKRGIIDWWGYRDDMHYALSLAHVVCLPSYREGLPKVLIESAAVGRAIVTTNVPGCNEIIEHGINGLLVPAKNVEMLAQSIECLVVDPELRKKLGKKGREIVENYYSINYVTTRFIEIADELVSV